MHNPDLTSEYRLELLRIRYNANRGVAQLVSFDAARADSAAAHDCGARQAGRQRLCYCARRPSCNVVGLEGPCACRGCNRTDCGALGTHPPWDQAAEVSLQCAHACERNFTYTCEAPA